MNTYLGLQDAVASFTGHLLAAMFPNCFGAEPPAGEEAYNDINKRHTLSDHVIAIDTLKWGQYFSSKVGND